MIIIIIIIIIVIIIIVVIIIMCDLCRRRRCVAVAADRSTLFRITAKENSLSSACLVFISLC